MSEADFMASTDSYWPDKWFAEKEAALGCGKKSCVSTTTPVADWMNKPPTAKQLQRIAFIRLMRGVVFCGGNRGQAQEFILKNGM